MRQGLIRLDGTIAEWKQLHLRMVWGQLGGHPEAEPHPVVSGGCPAMPTSLRGESTVSLVRMSERTLFPQLWDAVDATYRRFVPAVPADAAS